jgi:hypothetical protein
VSSSRSAGEGLRSRASPLSNSACRAQGPMAAAEQQLRSEREVAFVRRVVRHTTEHACGTKSGSS